MGHFAPDTTGGGNRWLNQNKACENETARAQSAGWKPVFEPPPALRNRPGFGGVCSALHTHRMTSTNPGGQFDVPQRRAHATTSYHSWSNREQTKQDGKQISSSNKRKSFGLAECERRRGFGWFYARKRHREREGFSRIRYAKINERKGTIDQLATNRASAPQHIQKKSRNASRTGPIQRISHQGKEAIHMFAD